jgi:hypothetical protein
MIMGTDTTHIPCFAITGHHRSGTSLVASLLQSAGLDIGARLLGADPSNKYGHFEDIDFLSFHIDVLTSQGYCPEGYILQKTVHVPEQHRARAHVLVQARMDTGQPWGWKEPRTTLFLDFWQGLIPHLGFLLLFRSPWEVVDSQYRRGHAIFRTNPNLAIQVWKTYNEALLDFAERFPDQCLLVEGPAAGPDPSLLTAAMARKFGLAPGPVENRFDGEVMARHASSHLPLVIRHFFPDAIAIYEKLRARAELVVSEERLWEESLTAGAALDWAFQHWHDLRETERKLQGAQADLEQIRQRQEETRQQLIKLGEAQATAEQKLHRAHEEGRQQLAQLELAQANLEESLREKRQAEAQARDHLTQFGQAQAAAEHLRHEKEQIQAQMRQQQRALADAEGDNRQAREEAQQRLAQLEQAQIVIKLLRHAKEQAEAVA